MHSFLNNRYRAQAELLCTQVLPALATVPSFALHGGSAINLFVLDLPRYSVDADVTFIPLMSREDTYREVNRGLKTIADKLKQKNSSLTITHSEKNLKLFIQSGMIEVKLEVNNIKRESFVVIQSIYQPALKSDLNLEQIMTLKSCRCHYSMGEKLLLL